MGTGRGEERRGEEKLRERPPTWLAIGAGWRVGG
jgi:hypothetical protein